MVAPVELWLAASLVMDRNTMMSVLPARASSTVRKTDAVPNVAATTPVMSSKTTAFMFPPGLLGSMRLTFGGSGAFGAAFREELEQAGRPSERARMVVMPRFFMVADAPLSQPALRNRV